MSPKQSSTEIGGLSILTETGFDYELFKQTADLTWRKCGNLVTNLWSLTSTCFTASLLYGLVINNDDPTDAALLSMQLCDQCTERSKKCPQCKWLNSQHSLAQLQELELIRKSITIKSEKSGQKYFECSYPFTGDMDTLYSADKSNHLGAIRTT